MKRKNLIFFIAVLLATALLTAGCQNNSSNTGMAETMTSVTEPSVQTTEEAVSTSTKEQPSETAPVLTTEDVPETEPAVTTEESPTAHSEPALTPVESIRVVLGSSAHYDLAMKVGLSPALASINCLPIFRLESTKDADQLCKLFAEGQGPGSEQNDLTEGLAAYDKAFYTDHELFVIYFCGGTRGYEPEYFTVDSLIRNQVLHLQVTLSYPIRPMDAAMGGYWIYVPMTRSETKTVMAFDATMCFYSYSEIPPDWSEPVNPDWRK